MKGHKKVRQRGKLGLSKIFAEMNPGDKVALVHNLSYSRNFPQRYHGRTATVIGKRGNAVLVSITDGKAEKKFAVQKINLKKLSS